MKKNLTSYIKKIVREYINETLTNYDVKSIFIKRLEKIPFEEQEKLFLNEIQILIPYSMYSPLNSLNENDILSLSLNVVKNTILKQYNFNDWQFVIRTMENNVEVAILIPNTDTYIKQLESDMKKMGYFCSLMENVPYNGLTYKIMRFEPLYQPNIREKEIGCETIYHLTPISNVDSIKKGGLKPMSNNKYFKYPNRVYFLRNDVSIGEIRKLAKGFRNTSQMAEDYVLIIVDVNKVPHNVSFHDDPNLKNAIYTYDKVPATSIVNIIELHINL